MTMVEHPEKIPDAPPKLYPGYEPTTSERDSDDLVIDIERVMEFLRFETSHLIVTIKVMDGHEATGRMVFYGSRAEAIDHNFATAEGLDNLDIGNAWIYILRTLDGGHFVCPEHVVDEVRLHVQRQIQPPVGFKPGDWTVPTDYGRLVEAVDEALGNPDADDQ